MNGLSKFENSFSALLYLICQKIDKKRLSLIRMAGPFANKIIKNRELRVSIIASLVIVLASIAALFIPFWQLALGPILLGVLHLIGDFRYLIFRPSLHKKKSYLIFCGLPLIIMILFRAPIWVGLFSLFFACLIARTNKVIKLGSSLLSLGIILIFYNSGFTGEIIFAHLHNLIAVLIWLSWRKRKYKYHLIPALLFLIIYGSMIMGVFAPIEGILKSKGFGLPDFFIDEQIALLGYSMPRGTGLRLVISFAMAQSVHYLVWIKLIAEDDRKQDTPRSFTKSLEKLEYDMGRKGLLISTLLCIFLGIWAIYSLFEARQGYLDIIRFHGVMELSALAFLYSENKIPVNQE